MKAPKYQFADQVRKARLKNNQSQKQLGETVGLDQKYISHIEQAELNLTLDTLEKVAKGLGRKVIIKMVAA